jgi:hypothetical protein
VLLGAAISVAVAQNAPPSPEKRAGKAVEVRQGLFNVQAFGPVGADTRKFQTHTKAKEKVWTDSADFAKKAAAFQSCELSIA